MNKPLASSLALMILAAVSPSSRAISAKARPRPRITAAQARQIALKKYPHARAERKAPLENEDGKWEYAVTVRDRRGKRVRMHEVMVGAMSGKIEADEETTPGEEAREKAAETRSRRSSSGGSKAKSAGP
jgi:hypothetical protein